MSASKQVDVGAEVRHNSVPDRRITLESLTGAHAVCANKILEAIVCVEFEVGRDPRQDEMLRSLLVREVNLFDPYGEDRAYGEVLKAFVRALDLEVWRERQKANTLPDEGNGVDV